MYRNCILHSTCTETVSYTVRVQKLYLTQYVHRNYILHSMCTETISYTVCPQKLYLTQYVHRNCILHSMCTETVSYTISRFTVTKCNEQTLDTSNPPDIIYVGSHYAVMQFQTATAYVVTTPSELFSGLWDLSMCQYYVW